MEAMSVEKGHSSIGSPTSKVGGGFGRMLTRRFSQPILDTKTDHGSQSAHHVVSLETTPERPSILARAKLNLGSLVTTGLNAPLDCPHSAPVLQTQSTNYRGSSHRRMPSAAFSTGIYHRLSATSIDTNGSAGSPPNFSAKSPLSAGGKVVGRLSSLLKREWCTSSEDADTPKLPRPLEILIRNRDQRHALVAMLLGNHLQEESLAVRFISAMTQLKATADIKERKNKARKLVSVFFDLRSNFFINDISKDVLSTLQRDHVEGLEQAKEHLLIMLETNEFVIQFLKEADREGFEFHCA